jgi:hypothetical protein
VAVVLHSDAVAAAAAVGSARDPAALMLVTAEAAAAGPIAAASIRAGPAADAAACPALRVKLPLAESAGMPAGGEKYLPHHLHLLQCAGLTAKQCPSVHL